MNIERPNAIYVSYEVRKALRFLGKAEQNRLREDHLNTPVTADFIADKILREFLQSNHPQLFEHQKKVEAMEKELLKTL